MALNTLPAGAFADDAISSDKINLANNFAFTGTVTGAGKIAQIVQATYDTNGQTVSADSFAQVGPSLSITPSATSSKIFVQCHGGSMYTATDKNIKWTIYRDSSNLGNTNGFYAHFFNSSFGMSGVSMSYLDSPNSTSSLTYATYIRTSSGSAVTAQDNTTRMVLTAMEVSA
tara:strand:- start:60 stop:575 length:516 start_codon:yes stop_codon:yes gene_type:complete